MSNGYAHSDFITVLLVFRQASQQFVQQTTHPPLVVPQTTFLSLLNLPKGPSTLLNLPPFQLWERYSHPFQLMTPLEEERLTARLLVSLGARRLILVIRRMSVMLLESLVWTAILVSGLQPQNAQESCIMYWLSNSYHFQSTGEFCCRDACPRNYCTAKEGIAPITPQPTLKPVTTTPGPTFNCNLEPDERARILTRLIEEVSTVDDLKQDGSPQNKALEWIVNLDLSEVCPSDDAAVQQLIVQRYVMAVFYYSTNGDEWKECSAPNRFTVNTITNADAECGLTTTNATQIFPNDLRGSNSWLSDGDVCTWGGLSW